MKAQIKHLLAAAVVALAALAALTTAAVAAPSPKASLCHVPPGNPSNVQAVSVGAKAVAAHLAHGDFYNLDGAWAGPFSQPGFSLYPIEVSLNGTCSPAGAVVASVDYPDFADCSGTWTLVSAAGTGYVVEEQIGAGCITGCRYRLTFDPATHGVRDSTADHVSGSYGHEPAIPTR